MMLSLYPFKHFKWLCVSFIYDLTEYLKCFFAIRCINLNARDEVLAEGMISGAYVFCPMHDWKINVVDGKGQDPDTDTGCVKTYKTEVVDGDVFIVL